jgi:hypothetical protein
VSDALTIEVNGVLLEAEKVAEAAERCVAALMEIREWRTFSPESDARELIDTVESLLKGESSSLVNQWIAGGKVTDA